MGYKTKYFGEIDDGSIHHFLNVNETEYGQTRYLKLVDNDGHIHCTLLMGMFAPLKYVSMPRMELTVATLSVKMS